MAPDLDTRSDPVALLTHAPPTGDRWSLDARLSRLRARLQAKGLSIEPPDDADAPEARPLGDAWRRRMSAFPVHQAEGVASTLGPVLRAPWPILDGCLGVVFTSRTGSTYLASELANRFKIGEMQESLNPDLVEGIAPADIVRSYANGWFSFKLGVPGMISAELIGAIEQYIETTHFIFLLRKDIVAQAVSLVKASQTGQWHSFSRPKCEPEYDATQLATSVRIIANAVGSLRTYLERAERPCRKLFYEDFASGDFSAAEAICDEFNIPRHEAGEGPKLVRLYRTADEVNASWRARFRDDMDERTAGIIDEYCANL